MSAARKKREGTFLRSRWILIRHKMCILFLLVERQYHGDTIPERKIVPGEVKPLAALVGQTAPMRVQIFLPSLSLPVALP